MRIDRSCLALTYLLIGSSVLWGCKKETEEPDPAPPAGGEELIALDEMLSDAQYAILETAPDEFIAMEGILLDNGLTVDETILAHDPNWLDDMPYQRDGFDASGLTADEQRYLLLAKMLVVGNYLVDDAEHTHPADGAGRPACSGLRYGYGSRRYWERGTPRGPANPNSGTTCAPDPGCTSEQIYALDCSAMVYWMGYYGGLRFSVDELLANTVYLADSSHWNDAFTATGADNYDELSMQCITGNLPAGQMQTGDVVCWSGHIGVVLGQGPDRWVYQSNGQPRQCPNSGSGCAANDNANRGPRMMRLTQSDLDQFGSSYTVLRIGGDCATSIEDFDGNVYEVVRIGDQCWCKEDLRTTHYANGDPIPEVTDQLDWENTTQGAYSAYNNDLGNLAEFGALYNGYAVTDPRNVCPSGWHVPSDGEWTTLSDQFGGTFEAGGPLKAVGTIQDGTGLWQAPNSGATNASGFTGLPGGVRWSTFEAQGIYGYWWTSTEQDAGSLWTRNMFNDFIDLNVSSQIKWSGFSVRCVRD